MADADTSLARQAWVGCPAHSPSSCGSHFVVRWRDIGMLWSRFHVDVRRGECARETGAAVQRGSVWLANGSMDLSCLEPNPTTQRQKSRPDEPTKLVPRLSDLPGHGNP